MSNYLFEGYEWTTELLSTILAEVEKECKEWGLTYYPNPNIEIVNFDQSIYYSNNIGLPTMYDHWSKGMSYLKAKKQYEQGLSGLAYESVINSNPIRMYILDTNSVTVQCMVMAHALGHGHVFTNNYMFKTWTIADFILDYMKFAKEYIKECEEKYGAPAVEALLDACHSLENFGVDKYKRPLPLNAAKLKAEYETYKLKAERQKNHLVSGQDIKIKSFAQFKDSLTRNLPEENLLYYIEKHSKVLKPWQKEIVRIVRKVAQYFYPQYQCKLLHEGFASFVHYEIMTSLYDKGRITDGSYLEFLHYHTQVIAQPAEHINVYAVGFAMFQDIKKRAIERGEDYKKVVLDIVENYRDETFILQFLSPEIVQEFKLFTLFDKDDNGYYEIKHVHDENDFKELREHLAKEWSYGAYFPTIEIVKVDEGGDLKLSYTVHRGVLLDYDEAVKTMGYISALWGGDNTLAYFDADGKQIDVNINKK